MEILKKIEPLEYKFKELSNKLSDPQFINDPVKFAKLNKEYKELEEILNIAEQMKQMINNLQQAKDIIENEKDAELIEMAKEEAELAEKNIANLEEQLKWKLIPKDPEDSKDAIMEIRAGTGGDEAAIFAGDLFRMYTKFFEKKGWKYEILNVNEGTMGGFKEIQLSVSGDEVFGILKFESGVHRVQRVPQTESAIRLTHIPTGIVVECQDERSQIKNYEKALKLLRTKIYEIEYEKRMKERAALRKSQVSTGDRSAKIRTYNFPQNRVTDHRIGLTLYNLDSFMEGDIDELIEALRIAENTEKLQQQNII
jgi:peptide chain release factor 1